MVLDALIRDVDGHVAFRERRPGVLQVLAPLFHEDGDMVDIFLDEPANGSGKVRITAAEVRAIAVRSRSYKLLERWDDQQGDAGEDEIGVEP
jgi:hypothetical protein